MSDKFLTSMTFASEFGMGCDCDECGKVPEPILAAMRKRKREQLESFPMKRTQHRSLVIRGDGQVAVWELVLPKTAEPFLEFGGSSHRVMWIQRLPKQSCLWTVGKGVLGCADEVSTRVQLDWKEGDVLFLPSNMGGKALGWIHETMVDPENDDATTTTTTTTTCQKESSGHAVMRIAKIPQDQLRTNVEKGETWRDLLLLQCQESLKMANETASPMFKLEVDQAKSIQEVLTQCSDQKDNMKLNVFAPVSIPSPKSDASPSVPK